MLSHISICHFIYSIYSEKDKDAHTLFPTYLSSISMYENVFYFTDIMP